jgi:hypothetical protein
MSGEAKLKIFKQMYGRTGTDSPYSLHYWLNALLQTQAMAQNTRNLATFTLRKLPFCAHTHLLHISLLTGFTYPQLLVNKHTTVWICP